MVLNPTTTRIPLPAHKLVPFERERLGALSSQPRLRRIHQHQFVIVVLHPLGVQVEVRGQLGVGVLLEQLFPCRTW